MSMGSAVFAGLAIVTDRPTDQGYSVGSNRPHPASAAMRPKGGIRAWIGLQYFLGPCQQFINQSTHCVGFLRQQTATSTLS